MRRVATARPLALLGAVAAVMFAAACGPKRIVQTPPTPTLIALLPDPESGVTGRARVSNKFGSADLDEPRAATRVTANGPPPAAHVITEAEAASLFGAALAALPPAPRHFTLEFQFESDSLTDTSTALIPAILTAVKELAVPDVVVVGHTDTLGDRKSNVALGLKRAISVRNVLIDAGLAPSTIEVASHGEADLLIKTSDNVPEPRNRRVEITVR